MDQIKISFPEILEFFRTAVKQAFFSFLRSSEIMLPRDDLIAFSFFSGLTFCPFHAETLAGPADLVQAEVICAYLYHGVCSPLLDGCQIFLKYVL